MNPITTVDLSGFKGIERRYPLGGPTILRGKNGSGKSACMEGLVYALTGKVPAGRKLDSVAGYFPRGQGHVTARDARGWIRRGIETSRAGKLSEQFEGSDALDDRGVAESWRCSETVLDVRELLALSAERRRQFVLGLCGGGEAKPDFRVLLATQYAKEIAGPAARAESLTRPEDLGDAGPLATAWVEMRGLSEQINAVLAGHPGRSLTESCAVILDAAKQGKLLARKRAQEADATAEDLRTKTRGKEVAADRLNAARFSVEALETALADGKRRLAIFQERQTACVQAKDAFQAAAVQCDRARDALSKTPVAEPRPEPPEEPMRTLRAFDERLMAIQNELAQAIKLSEERENILLGIRDYSNEISQIKAQLHAQAEDSMGQLVAVMAEITDYAHGAIPRLRAAVEAVSADWNRRKEENEEELAQNEACEEKSQRILTDFDREHPPEMYSKQYRDELNAQIHLGLSGRDKLEFEETQARTSHRNALGAWDARDRARNTAALAHSNATAKLEAAKQRFQDATENLGALHRSPQDEISALQARLAELKELEAAALQDATLLSHRIAADAETARQRTLEDAWKAAERAIAALRETQVGESTAPLLEDVKAILAAAGREEEPYLALENTRGTPIFEVGWTRDGQKIPIESLSSGEAVIFCAALSVAITRRSPGRRILLVEADPLDTGNLEAVLRALVGLGSELDALIVATASEGFEVPAGWSVIRLGETAAL